MGEFVVQVQGTNLLGSNIIKRIETEDLRVRPYFITMVIISSFDSDTLKELKQQMKRRMFN